jgi:aspartate/methionine/tyrosine aminotransferase
MKEWTTSRRMNMVKMPPVARIMDRVRTLRARGESVFSMAQAVPWYGPPERALLAMLDRLEEDGFHNYSPDPGFMSTRKALSRDIESRRGISLDPSSQLHLTCGASQAFLGALLTAADPGDGVIVLEPWYFDHIFAVLFCSLERVSIPMIESEGWELPVSGIERELGGARVLVLVNPGNPTGSVLRKEELEWLIDATEEAGCYLIIDETYERFNFEGSDWHPWQDSERDHVLTIGSFSKSLGIPGWRLGYLFGASHLLDSAIKVQDSVVICPPTPAQILLEEALVIEGWVEKRALQVRERLIRCRTALSEAAGLDWRECGGGFFTLAACPGRDSLETSMKLLEEYRIATIPGAAFGQAGEGHVRISFGCLADEELDPAMEALASVRI